MKPFKKNSFLTFFLTCFFFASYAQTQINFTHLTSLDGLSQSTVQAIVKDRYGFMWFGTQDGLNRYDGYSFKVYRHKPKDSTSLRKSHIISLYEDRQGNLWVGTANGGLSLYDRKHDAFIHYKEMLGDRPGLSQKSVTAIYEDKQNNFWIGTYWKLNLLDRKTGRITQIGNDPADPNSISSDGITCLFEDSRSNLWVGTNNGLNLMDRKTRKFKRIFHTEDPRSISNNYITTIYEDSKGRLWVGTSNGLNLMDPVTGSCKRFQTDIANPKSLGNNQVAGIEDAGDGKLWIGTRVYLDLFDPEKNEFTHFESNPNIQTSLNKNGNITAMLRDRDGLLWIGTYQGGINKYDRHLTFFDSFRNNPTDWQSLSFNIVTSFAENRDGDIWIGTGGGGLNLWQRKTNSFLRINPDPADKNSLSSWGVLCLYQSKRNDYLWIGTYGNGVDRYDPKTKMFKHFTKGDNPDQLNNDAVYAILEDSKGNIWMGTNGGGVNVLDQKTGVITRYLNDPNNENSLAGNYVRCFFEDDKGNIWIGNTGGVSMLNPSAKSFTNYTQNNTELESDVVFSIYQDGKGNIWVGTLGGGLTKLDPKTKNIKAYSTSEGLPDNTINSIIEDNSGYLWLSTNTGISRLNPLTGEFKNMGLDNGIQSFEFSQGAGLKTRSGEILFGGVNGFNVLHPDHLIENKIGPPVVITDFRIFNKPVMIGDNSLLQQDILETKKIVLSYDQSIISFGFAALNFTASRKNQYAYMLEGFDKGWIYSGLDRVATYTNLDPGEYTFRVKASNNDGVWNDQGTSIRIIITPPFWQTWWFKLLLVLLALGVVYVIYRIRVKTINQHREQLETQVQERTESLAQMTVGERKARLEASEANRELERKNRELEQFAYVASHDMQEPLRTISSFVELLQNQYKDSFDEKAHKYMNYIVQASDRMKVLINDLLEYSRIGRKKEAARVDLNETVGTVLADLNTAITEAGAEIRIGTLPVIQAYPTEIKQLFQNLLINAIKFRKKEHAPVISVNAERSIEGHWKFCVSDNGIGIDPSQSDRIFVIFQRLHTRNEYEGSGIGLSHCKKIAELHKGKIWVESTPGKGSSFYFTICEVSNGMHLS